MRALLANELPASNALEWQLPGASGPSGQASDSAMQPRMLQDLQPETAPSDLEAPPKTETAEVFVTEPQPKSDDAVDVAPNASEAVESLEQPQEPEAPTECQRPEKPEEECTLLFFSIFGNLSTLTIVWPITRPSIPNIQATPGSEAAYALSRRSG